MKHTEATGKTRSGSVKRLAIEGAGVRASGVPPSPRDRRVPRGAYKSASESPKAIEDLRGRL
jgi:hypothetical protein